jgi:hypothetical protein
MSTETYKQTPETIMTHEQATAHRIDEARTLHADTAFELNGWLIYDSGFSDGCYAIRPGRSRRFGSVVRASEFAAAN